VKGRLKEAIKADIQDQVAELEQDIHEYCSLAREFCDGVDLFLKDAKRPAKNFYNAYPLDVEFPAVFITMGIGDC
jgi:hypothetical protein